MAAPPSGELHLTSGVHNTVDLRLTHARNSRPSFDVAASSDGDGSRVLTTQRKISVRSMQWYPLT